MREYFQTMTLTDSRLAYKIETYSVNSIKLNFKSDKRYKSEGWLCDDCKDSSGDGGERGGHLSRIPYGEAKVTAGNIPQPGGYLDSQEHVKIHCVKNNEIRKGKNLDNLQDCVFIFKQVLIRRAKQAKLG